MLGKISVVVLLASAMQSVAQSIPSLPSGWMSQDIGDAIVIRSSSDNTTRRVMLTILPPGHPIGNAQSWFGNQVLAIAKMGGQVLASTSVTERAGILIRVVELENKNNVQLRNIFYGYPTSRGMSITMLTIAPAVSDQDPLIQTANQYVQQLAAQKFELSESTAQSQPPSSSSGTPARNAQGQYAGEFGRSDIDLTYHAKAVIPKERDVPLKGVYVFIGYGFGASYGGVGTTMTWGQQANQQLLLLFANGVVAKTDLRGGNLAGKYQAEGFATMDVANPTNVSGSPFGHWTEDDNAVHIQWNIGAPSDLTKNGDNLLDKNEKWTPFYLAEGELIEGTFVRKMEAGLRSQSIILHKNGTFIGDGVNVTMGGSMVNPAFPERGSGTYEVHKGSMILYFSNGFTQAIACILDKTSGGDAKTVVLNGFPFERVR